MLPAHECFHPDEMKTTNINLRLVLNKKLRSFKSGSQIVFQHELFQSARRSARSVKLIDVATQTLGAIERGTSILQQPTRIAAIVRIETDADTARYKDLLIFEEKSLIECT